LIKQQQNKKACPLRHAFLLVPTPKPAGFFLTKY
jgi:hypothetical protein